VKHLKEALEALLVTNKTYSLLQARIHLDNAGRQVQHLKVNDGILTAGMICEADVLSISPSSEQSIVLQMSLSDSTSLRYPNTEKRVENTTRSRVILTKFEVFG